ncbi:hypothetical protein BJ170DRAFT_718192 [Xylariales sp. AK1849]|nr:hypothetical protein BJ170DRAFT_718192 [Xylariales sp. AK1849]
MTYIKPPEFLSVDRNHLATSQRVTFAMAPSQGSAPRPPKPEEFLQTLQALSHPYGNGQTTSREVPLRDSLKLQEWLSAKQKVFMAWLDAVRNELRTKELLDESIQWFFFVANACLASNDMISNAELQAINEKINRLADQIVNDTLTFDQNTDLFTEASNHEEDASWLRERIISLEDALLKDYNDYQKLYIRGRSKRHDDLLKAAGAVESGEKRPSSPDLSSAPPSKKSKGLQGPEGDDINSYNVEKFNDCYAEFIKRCDKYPDLEISEDGRLETMDDTVRRMIEASTFSSDNVTSDTFFGKDVDFGNDPAWINSPGDCHQVSGNGLDTKGLAKSRLLGGAPPTDDFQFYHADDLVRGLCAAGRLPLPADLKAEITAPSQRDQWRALLEMKNRYDELVAEFIHSPDSPKPVLGRLVLLGLNWQAAKTKFKQGTTVPPAEIAEFRDTFRTARVYLLLSSLLCWNACKRGDSVREQKSNRLSDEERRCEAVLRYEELRMLGDALMLETGNRPNRELAQLYTDTDQRAQERDERIKEATDKIAEARRIRDDNSLLDGLVWPPRRPGDDPMPPSPPGNKDPTKEEPIHEAIKGIQMRLDLGQDSNEALDVDTQAALRDMIDQLESLKSSNTLKRPAVTNPKRPAAAMNGLPKRRRLSLSQLNHPPAMPGQHPFPEPVRIITVPNGVMPAGLKLVSGTAGLAVDAVGAAGPKTGETPSAPPPSQSPQTPNMTNLEDFHKQVSAISLKPPSNSIRALLWREEQVNKLKRVFVAPDTKPNLSLLLQRGGRVKDFRSNETPKGRGALWPHPVFFEGSAGWSL